MYGELHFGCNLLGFAKHFTLTVNEQEQRNNLLPAEFVFPLQPSLTCETAYEEGKSECQPEKQKQKKASYERGNCEAGLGGSLWSWHAAAWMVKDTILYMHVYKCVCTQTLACCNRGLSATTKGGRGDRGREGDISGVLLLWTPHLGIHYHKTLDTAQPFHLLKPNWKPSSSHSIFIPTNIGTQFLLLSLYICVCVCACMRACVCACMHACVWCVSLFVCITLYVNCFGRTVLYMCIEYYI